MSTTNLEVVDVPIDTVYEDPANARRHPQRNMDAIKGSLRHFGQVEPLVVQKSTGKVIGGNGRLAGMKELGWSTVKVAYVDVNDIQAASLGIALNRTGELAEWDYEALSDQIRVLLDQSEDLESLGWLPHEVEPMLQAEWNPPAVEELPGRDEEDYGMTQPIVIAGDQREAILKAVAIWRERTGDYGSMDGEIIQAICSAWAKENSRGVSAAAGSESATT